jgi:hypothetical protein
LRWKWGKDILACTVDRGDVIGIALDEGESCASIEQALPQASKAFTPDSNGLWWIDQAHFAADFAADIPRDEAEFMAIAQVPISTDSFTHQVKNPAWKHKPTFYMVAIDDRSINPEQVNSDSLHHVPYSRSGEGQHICPSQSLLTIAFLLTL